MRKILLFGNSGSSKSTLSKKLCIAEDLAHLDLDILAFKKDFSTERRNVDESMHEIERFIGQNESWVIEGGYTDLLEILLSQATEIIFMNLPTETCLKNTRNRPWEPHKYESKEAQDNNLDMLQNWIQDYYKRNDLFSEYAHIELYQKYTGKKTMVTSNQA